MQLYGIFEDKFAYYFIHPPITHNLNDLISSKSSNFTENEIKIFIFKLLQLISFLHGNSILQLVNINLFSFI